MKRALPSSHLLLQVCKMFLHRFFHQVLDLKLFDAYMELKCEPIIAIIEPNMYQVDIPLLPPASCLLPPASCLLPPAPYPLPPVSCLLNVMPQGKYDWAKCVRPTAARNYVKDLLHSAVCVHAEVWTQLTRRQIKKRRLLAFTSLLVANS